MEPNNNEPISQPTTGANDTTTAVGVSQTGHDAASSKKSSEEAPSNNKSREVSQPKESLRQWAKKKKPQGTRSHGAPSMAQGQVAIKLGLGRNSQFRFQARPGREMEHGLRRPAEEQKAKRSSLAVPKDHFVFVVPLLEGAVVYAPWRRPDIALFLTL